MELIVIVDLQDTPEFIPTIAAWHHAEWAALNPGQTLEQRIARMGRYLSDGLMPRMFVWVKDGQPVGTAAFVRSDMETRPELSPWLASVYVKAESRGKGVAAALVQKVVSHAAAAGFPELFLFTPSKEHYYAKLGWQTLFHEDYHGQRVTVMKIGLQV
jgi:predicted N-acetyltransferase YhbS